VRPSRPREMSVVRCPRRTESHAGRSPRGPESLLRQRRDERLAGGSGTPEREGETIPTPSGARRPDRLATPGARGGSLRSGARTLQCHTASGCCSRRGPRTVLNRCPSDALVHHTRSCLHSPDLYSTCSSSTSSPSSGDKSQVPDSSSNTNPAMTALEARFACGISRSRNSQNRL
jgi:hypothetical protein